jgi:hypothetical protein
LFVQAGENFPQFLPAEHTPGWKAKRQAGFIGVVFIIILPARNTLLAILEDGVRAVVMIALPTHARS